MRIVADAIARYEGVGMAKAIMATATTWRLGEGMRGRCHPSAPSSRWAIGACSSASRGNGWRLTA